MLRFQREAELLASLNHPNIAHIYGVQERALVMELVEGESPKGPLPFEDAWKIMLQIADAREVPDFFGWRRATAMAPGWKRTLLCISGFQTDGSGRDDPAKV